VTSIQISIAETTICDMCLFCYSSLRVSIRVLGGKSQAMKGETLIQSGAGYGGHGIARRYGAGPDANPGCIMGHDHIGTSCHTLLALHCNHLKDRVAGDFCRFLSCRESIPVHNNQSAGRCWLTSLQISQLHF
jgi:hypothetical protein